MNIGHIVILDLYWWHRVTRYSYDSWNLSMANIYILDFLLRDKNQMDTISHIAHYKAKILSYIWNMNTYHITCIMACTLYRFYLMQII